jgi:hypothetical protein
MKKFTLILTVTLALAVIPAMALAHCGSCAMDDKSAGSQKQAAKHDHDDHKDHAGHDHSGMAAAGGMLDLGAKVENGVKATASMKDVGAAMAKMGMKTTHHFMVSFADEKSAKAIDSGSAAVKITGPDGTVTGPMELMGMQGHFGADVILDKKGEYTFQVGSKLADGTKRQYEFKTVVK